MECKLKGPQVNDDQLIVYSTITRAPVTPGWMTPDSLRKPTLPPVPLNSPMQIEDPIPITPARYRSTSSIIHIPYSRADSGGLGYRHVDPSGPLPRNLYVMGLPLDLTQYVLVQ